MTGSSDNRILLLHCTSRRDPEAPFARSAGRTAPLGLACLQAMDPARIALLDLQDQDPLLDRFADLPRDRITACLVQAPHAWEDPEAARIGSLLRACFPHARLILAGRSDLSVRDVWHHTLHGTGRLILWRVLGGNLPDGRHLDTLAEDLREPLPVPGTPLPDAGWYRSGDEKLELPASLSVYRPWLGPLDRWRRELDLPAPTGFFPAFCRWMQESGFRGLSFEGPGLTPARLSEISRCLARTGLHGAVTLPVIDRLADFIPNLEPPFVRLWLAPGRREQPNPPEDLPQVLEPLQQQGIRLGLRLDPRNAPFWVPSATSLLADRISLEDPASWPPILLRRTLLAFFGRQRKFWYQLFDLRSLHDLICFLRFSFGLLDFLLGKERNPS